tara:strand:+ start:508 stop:756 length:249 start_codon:yes stop_codon:yes gene_type:complete
MDRGIASSFKLLNVIANAAIKARTREIEATNILRVNGFLRPMSDRAISGTDTYKSNSKLVLFETISVVEIDVYISSTPCKQP